MDSLVRADNVELQKKTRYLANFYDDTRELRPFMNDKLVTDIFVIGTGEIIVKRFARGQEYTGIFLPPAKVKGIILSAASLRGIILDPANGKTVLEDVLPDDSHYRIEGILPPSLDNPELALRSPPHEVYPLEDYLAKGRMTQEQYDTVCTFIKDRKNILVGGSTGSGKSTFTNACIKKMVEYTPNDRFYIVEDVPELQCEAHNKTMVHSLADQAASFIRVALRWNPDRIIFGEVRYGDVANELIKAWNTGHDGNITTIHADSCESMLLRMRSLLGEVLPGRIPELSETIHLCVHLTGTKNGPVVDEVMPVKGGETDDLIASLEQNGLG